MSASQQDIHWSAVPVRPRLDSALVGRLVTVTVQTTLFN